MILAIVSLLRIIAEIISIMYSVKLAKAFGKGTGFAIGLIFLSPIFILILGLGDSTYHGAQSCRSTADIDKYKWVDEDKLYQDNDFVNDYHLSRHCIGLSGMKFTDKEIEELARRIRKMKEHGTHLCCSIGFLTEKQAKMLKEAGLDRIKHNLNSSRSYYHNICSTHTFEQRVQNIHMLQGLGFEICSGGIIGMGESKEDVVDMLLELREIQPEALPINFLLPIKGTPLGDACLLYTSPSPRD